MVGRLWHLYLSAFVLAAISTFGWGSFAKADTPKYTDSKLWAMAAKMDYLGLEKPRAVLANGYISPFGIQVHSSCFKFARANGISREDAEAGIERVFTRAFEAVAVTCSGKYPELGPYLNQWIAQFRRTIITCTKEKQKEFGFGAMNIGPGIGLWWHAESEARDGIDTSGAFGLGAYASNYKTTILYPQDTFLEAISAPVTSSDIDAVIHEVLHSTDANNRLDHNSIEYIGAGTNGICGKDITLDRLNVVATMCSGDKLVGTLEGTPEYLFRKMGQCGTQQCENLFTSDMKPGDLPETFIEAYSPNKGLPKDKAASLCARLYDEGACHYDLHTQGANITKSALKPLTDIGNRIRDRLYNLFPNSPVQINNEILKLYPKQRDRLLSFSSTECFKSVFNNVVGDHLYLKKAEPLPFRKNPTPDSNANETFRMIRREIVASPKCEDPVESNDFIRAVNDLDNLVGNAFSSTAYTRLAKPRYQHEAENSYKPATFDASDNEAFRNLLGAPLYDEYLATLKRFHYASPDFDCLAAHLRPLRNATSFQTLLAGLNTPAVSCPTK